MTYIYLDDGKMISIEMPLIEFMNELEYAMAHNTYMCIYGTLIFPAHITHAYER